MLSYIHEFSVEEIYSLNIFSQCMFRCV